MSDEKRPPGRPLEYKPEYCAMVEKLKAKGLTDEECADVLGVAHSTYKNWKVKFPEFMASNVRGLEASNSEVKTSLYKAARGGYVVKETIKDADGVVIRVKEKEMPIDVTAVMKILFNTDPKNWRERIDLTHGGELEIVDKETRRKRIAELRKKLKDRLGE